MWNILLSNSRVSFQESFLISKVAQSLLFKFLIIVLGEMELQHVIFYHLISVTTSTSTSSSHKFSQAISSFQSLPLLPLLPLLSLIYPGIMWRTKCQIWKFWILTLFSTPQRCLRNLKQNQWFISFLETVNKMLSLTHFILSFLVFISACYILMISTIHRKMIIKMGDELLFFILLTFLSFFNFSDFQRRTQNTIFPPLDWHMRLLKR